MMRSLISSFIFLKNYEQIWKIVGETRVQWVLILRQISILCSTNGLPLLFAVSLGKKLKFSKIQTVSFQVQIIKGDVGV